MAPEAPIVGMMLFGLTSVVQTPAPIPVMK
jgi:hypothetical protein